MVRVNVQDQSREIEAELHMGSRDLAADVVEAWEAFVVESEKPGV